MHEPTFRAVLAEAGLNPYLLDMANIREHCSWITATRRLGTAKAQDADLGRGAAGSSGRSH